MSVGLGVLVGVLEAGVVVGVGDPTDVGVDVGLGVPPRTVRLVETNAISVSTLLPVETRALHSNVVWPACKPFALKVKAAPLFALLP